MKRLTVLIFTILLPFTVFAKNFVNVAVHLDLKDNVIIGLMDIDGKQTLFNFPLKKADYNDGHTYVIYRQWLPDMPAGYGLRIHIAHPDNFMVVTESNRYTTTKKGTQYEFDNPADGVVLAFSDRWIKNTVSYKGIDISTYFTKENEKYTKAYFSRLEQLLDIYTKKLGAYPFSSFNVVDVPYPVGHALKSLTFIYSRIIGMPFLTKISLGHELVHQWAGVGVEPDPKAGNWSEGLTTFLADRFYADMDGKAAQYRKNALLSYMADARQGEKDTALKDFKFKTGGGSQAVGYAKGMMVFTMLESMLGPDDFYRGIRLFLKRHMHGKAGWDDIRQALEDTSGIDLRGFFKGWLSEPNLAEFFITGEKVTADLKGYTLSFDVKNKFKDLEYPLDITVQTEQGEKHDYLYMKGAEKAVNIKTDSMPTGIVIDPQYMTARMLRRGEAHPVLHQLFSKYKKVVFVDPAKRDRYVPLILSLSGTKVVSDAENPYQYTDKIMVFMGEGNRAFKKLMHRNTPKTDSSFMVKGYMHPLSLSKAVYYIKSADSEASSANARRITHYGKYSSLSADGPGYDKVIDKSLNGYTVDIKRPDTGVTVNKPLSVKDITDKNPDSRVFYMGEVHDSFAHHYNQLELIKDLVSSGRDVAVGLEYIQRPFQKYLGEYINGIISQREMLEKTEYYKRWSFDFRLYKRIFDYAQEHHIPLVALNLRQEITKKVSAGGIASLDKKMLAEIPSDIEFTGGFYRDYLQKVFAMHAMHHGGGDFGDFYEAQLLWDETMARSAADYLKAHPEKTLVVLAGNGHIRYRMGIPDRVERRTGLKGTVIVQDEDYKAGIADYILYPQEMEYQHSPKIGVMVENSSKGLKVIKVTKHSVAEKAGVKAGDYVTELNGQQINDLSGIRLALLYVEKGEQYNLTVRRGGENVKLKASF